MLDAINDFLISYGYIGFGLACLLAGTFFPFSSEAVMVALLLSSAMDPRMTIISGTIGNVAGSMVNYYVGSMVNLDTVLKLFKVKKSRILRAQGYVQKYGAIAGFFSFVPLLGTAISIVLGILKVPVGRVFIFTTIGKFLRYVIVAYSVVAFL